jgi:hypothetical protein
MRFNAEIESQYTNLYRIPSGNYMVDGVGQPGVGYFARFAT